MVNQEITPNQTDGFNPRNQLQISQLDFDKSEPVTSNPTIVHTEMSLIHHY